jgi:hypothetical protein
MSLNLFTRLAVAMLLAYPVVGYAESADTPPRPDRNPSRQAAPKRNPARVEAPEAEHPVLPGDAPTVAWTDAEVAAAKADCAKKLAGVALEYEQLPPLKEGICGAPAPIRVTSIGSVPKVAIDPPATVTCSVAAGVGTWLDKTVQPKARALMGAPVIKLHNATSYACRNRYGGETTPLSEHALANALDISEFVFQTGKTVTVLAAWPHGATVPPSPLPNPIRVADGSSDDVTGSISSISTSSVGSSIVKAVKAKPNARPKTPPVAAPPPETSSSDANSEFFRTVHDEACNVFGTVLGPEANEAHKNHFHLDMKKRRHSAFCE